MKRRLLFAVLCILTALLIAGCKTEETPVGTELPTPTPEATVLPTPTPTVNPNKFIEAPNGSSWEIELISDAFIPPDDNNYDTGASHPTILEIQHSEEYNGRLLVSFFYHNEGQDGNNPTTFKIIASDDGGESWHQIADVKETLSKRTDAAWNPCFYELPCDFGDMKEGTILLAGGSVNKGPKRYSQLSLYKSVDGGENWEEISEIVSSKVKTKYGVWEPVLYYEEGYLYCFYSDDTNEQYDQSLVYTRTKDGINWEKAKLVVCTEGDFEPRPGMISITKMGNGKYFACYEIDSYIGCVPIFYKTSSRIDSWVAHTLGKQILDENKVGLGAAPRCLWVEAGGENGTLIVSAKYNTSEQLFVSYDYGKTFERIENPLPHPEEGYFGLSPCFYADEDGQTVYYVNTVYYDGRLGKIAFCKIKIHND